MHRLTTLFLELEAAMATDSTDDVRHIVEALAELLGDEAAIDVVRRLIDERTARRHEAAPAVSLAAWRG